MAAVVGECFLAQVATYSRPQAELSSLVLTTVQGRENIGHILYRIFGKVKAVATFGCFTSGLHLKIIMKNTEVSNSIQVQHRIGHITHWVIRFKDVVIIYQLKQCTDFTPKVID